MIENLEEELKESWQSVGNKGQREHWFLLFCASLGALVQVKTKVIKVNSNGNVVNTTHRKRKR